eukprot:CAMPEP_0180275150 /NCGR_PEP_ID=MMETSP0988-20121125/5696_1 /TAXON_ID=697907 /ORGANISM="non described non described, Strain CCMP2293" /LENGTH=103 /DNA_ID=CAMNT_0022246411 /DNA_START=23 /DNA_END=334 /DNA_ORIENTATION=-
MHRTLQLESVRVLVPPRPRHSIHLGEVVADAHECPDLSLVGHRPRPDRPPGAEDHREEETEEHVVCLQVVFLRLLKALDAPIAYGHLAPPKDHHREGKLGRAR